MEIVLDRIDAIEVLKEIPTEGHLPLKVIGNDFSIYFAKSGKAHEPPITITNELLCSFLLKIWEVASPEIVLIDLKPETIRIPLSHLNKPLYYRNVCFGSKDVGEGIELNLFFESNSNKAFNKIDNPEDFFWISLFDIWVENEDRKPSNPNLILSQDSTSKNYKIYAIDHAYSFFTRNYEHLNPGYGALLPSNDSLLDSAMAKGFKKRMKADYFKTLKANFFSKISDCEDNFSNIVSVIPAELRFSEADEQSVRRFLFDHDRNENVYENFLSRL